MIFSEFTLKISYCNYVLRYKIVLIRYLRTISYTYFCKSATAVSSLKVGKATFWTSWLNFISKAFSMWDSFLKLYQAAVILALNILDKSFFQHIKSPLPWKNRQLITERNVLIGKKLFQTRYNGNVTRIFVSNYLIRARYKRDKYRERVNFHQTITMRGVRVHSPC